MPQNPSLDIKALFVPSLSPQAAGAARPACSGAGLGLKDETFTASLIQESEKLEKIYPQSPWHSYSIIHCSSH